MKKGLILTASVLMFGLFAFTSVANVTTTNNTNNIECVGEDCDKCGKKDCKGKCDTKKSSKKETTSEQKKACCSKSAKKSCSGKKAEATEEKKN